MLYILKSGAINGISTINASVEVDISERGMPYFDIIGLGNKSIEESKLRVKTAIQNSGFVFPNKKITVNLTPADIPKQGSFYDFPIAMGILTYINNLKIPDSVYFFGELSLNGGLKYTKSAFIFTLHAHTTGITHIFLPESCAREASFFLDISVVPVTNLNQAVNYFKGEMDKDFIKLHKISRGKNGRDNEITDLNNTNKSKSETERCFGSGEFKFTDFDFSDVRGQRQAKRALEISVAGIHNIILLGAPGVGKTMLANKYKYMLPSLSREDHVEVLKIHSISNIVSDELLKYKIPPFRSPHHSISYVGMIGGGANLVPGEISLAHKGVLFLDEFPELSREVIEMLREPLESGYIRIVRNRNSYTFPAKFTLIASCNPCPCGFYGSKNKKCSCTPRQIMNYWKKISGPIMDRIDLQVRMETVDAEDMRKNRKKSPGGDYSASDRRSPEIENLRLRITNARDVQISERGTFNCYLNNNQVENYCNTCPEGERILDEAFIKFGMSIRSYYKILKISRTIADLENSGEIKTEHILEALQYRINA